MHHSIAALEGCHKQEEFQQTDHCRALDTQENGVLLVFFVVADLLCFRWQYPTLIVAFPVLIY